MSPEHRPIVLPKSPVQCPTNSQPGIAASWRRHAGWGPHGSMVGGPTNRDIPAAREILRQRLSVGARQNPREISALSLIGHDNFAPGHPTGVQFVTCGPGNFRYPIPADQAKELAFTRDEPCRPGCTSGRLRGSCRRVCTVGTGAGDESGYRVFHFRS